MQTAGSTCEFWVNPVNFTLRSLLAGRSRVRVGQFSGMAEGQDAGRYNGLHEPYMTYHGARMNL
jgi:hypothetical protein